MRWSYFVIDDVTPKYEGITFGDRWNGWQMPYFLKPMMLRILADANYHPNLTPQDGYLYRYDEKFDKVVCDEYIDNVLVDTYNEDVIEYGGKKFYGVGTGSWVWEETTINK